MNPETKLQRLQLLEEKKRLREQLPHLHSLKHYRWSREFFESRNKMCLLTAANQLGKALRYGQEIPTPTGYKQIEELRPGDLVFTQTGNITTVLDIPFDGEADCYRVVFDDGAEVDVSGDHLWTVKTYEQRFRKHHRTYGQWQVLSTRELIEICGYATETTPPKRAATPACGPVEYAARKLPIDPYVLGTALGNGSFGGSLRIHTVEPEIQKRVLDVLPLANISANKKAVNCPGIYREIQDLGLSDVLAETKFIPRSYLLSGVEQRWELLRGLMDTDGYVSAKGVLEYCTVSPQLAADFVELLSSLGGMINRIARVKTHYTRPDGSRVSCQDAVRIFFRVQRNPFFLVRKAARFRPVAGHKHERLIYRIEHIGRYRTRCITVKDPSGTFLVGKNFVVTHNSTVQIRKMIHWATEKSLWPTLWHNAPRQFWYLYPTKDIVELEFETKWRYLLPHPDLKDHPQFGWKLHKTIGRPSAIEFNSGVWLVFKTYAQDVQTLQAGTVSYIGCDEELVADLWDELRARLTATNGYFSLVFTATLGQEFWRETMEVKGKKERFPLASKWQISLFDCLQYEDGSSSHWSKERIQEIIAGCSSESEVQRRVYGKFVVSDGRRYEAYSADDHNVEAVPVPKDWLLYGAVDPGGGGRGANMQEGSATAIILLAVAPDYSRGRVVDAWRGDGIHTTAADALARYQEMKRNWTKRGYRVINAAYDYASRDFYTIACRVGEPFVKAEKNRDAGVELVNALFRQKVLTLDTGDGGGGDPDGLQKVAFELLNIVARASNSIKYVKQRDDLSDALRYACMLIPWNWTSSNPFQEDPVPVEREPETDAEQRRKLHIDSQRKEMMERRGELSASEPEDECEEWNAMYG